MTNMSWYEAARLLGAILGAVLLWGILSSGIRRKGRLLPLLLLIAAVALWFSGEALRLLITQALPGSLAAAYAGRVALLGLALAPSALLATFLALAIETERPAAHRLQRYLMAILLLAGLSVFLLGEVCAHTPQRVLAFNLYAIVALALSAHFCRRLINRYETEVHRRFYGLMAVALIGIAFLVGIVYAAKGIGPSDLARVLSLFLFLSPIAPAFILGYFVYRYSFFRIVVNPALFYSILTGIVLTVYLLGIRRIAEQFRHIQGGFRPEVVEAVLLTLLVFLFQPVKNRLQRFISRLFFKARYEYQHLLGELSQTLNVPLALEQRLQEVVDAISVDLKVNLVSLTLFDREEGEIQNLRIIESRGLPGLPPGPTPFSRGKEDRFRVDQVAEWLSTYGRPLDTGELHHWRFVTPLVAQGVQLCIPVQREEQVIGFLCLGEKKREVPFSGEERELLATLCNQIALAVENARLVEARLAMERRMYEAERLSSLGLLSASIAHEVKNPLSSIKTIAAVLREDLRENQTAVEDLSMVLNEIDRLSHVVGRLLRFARPENEEAFHAVDLKEVLDDVVLLLAHEAEQQHVVLRAEVEEDLAVWGHLEDLKEIFFNLILNGIQATEGEAEGVVAVKGQRHAEVEVEIAVTDTGPGIPDEVLPRIFEPFYTTRAAGTGLGLATVKRDVEHMGGTIDAASRAAPERGAMFVVRLPGGEHETENPDRG